MACYRHDGSFEGFLRALAHALEAGDEAPDFTDGADEADGGLFRELAVDAPMAPEVALAFRERFVAASCREAFATLRHAFYSRRRGVERLLWEYVCLGFEQGERICSMLADRRVNQVDRLARAVAREAHKYKGFVRFRELEQGVLYARIEPEYDILVFLAPHFVRRVGDRSWMIHDLRRSAAALYDLNGWRLVNGVTLTGSPEYTRDEDEFSRLWRLYFQRLAIEARHNPKLQQQHVPLRSRKHLVEFE